MPNDQQINPQAAADSRKYENLHIIPVVGPFGSGKSTFINQLLGKELVQVGHLLDACTTDFQAIEVPASTAETNLPKWDPTKKLIIVDTPGFDDADDSLMLRKLARWLTDTYGGGAKLAGVIYLYDMTGQRLTTPPYKNFQAFEKLCRSGACRSVVLGTTKWQRIPDEELKHARMREKQLLERFWNGMADRGSKAERVDDALSTWKLVDTALHEGGPPIILVLGETGTIKNMFIRSAQGNLPSVNHQIASLKAPVDAFEVGQGYQSVLLVDTPGFNHTEKSDRKVLAEITSWLRLRKRGDQVAGVIFLLDSASREHANARVDKLGIPIVQVTVQCYAIAEEQNTSVTKYVVSYQRHLARSIHQYETPWDVINDVLALNTRIPAQSVGLEQAGEKRSNVLLSLFRALFKFISHRTERPAMRKLDFQGHQD
ncbi:hypothetical protein D9619_000483 [Psilocybe cf. subviscida]|uniref:G domain-containing protein n=1 Tax=Psilocybe cf. subviscida TaxID=2480587 RepID=A0A8H5BDN8_9AGAR|nr:hypothetical protein D9619_000483 [Psilocybe cf. subviscida]